MEHKEEFSRQAAKRAMHEKLPDSTILGVLGVFAGNLSFSYTKINRPSIQRIGNRRRVSRARAERFPRQLAPDSVVRC
jgi:hypothetical protein